MHTVVPGWFGVSAVWFIPLIWRLVKSVLPGGAGLRGPGTIRLWLGFVGVLVASCALEAMLIDITGFNAFGHALSGGLGKLIGHTAAPLVMTALLVVSLPWLLDFHWREFLAWADISLGLGLNIRASRDSGDSPRRERRSRRAAADDGLPAHSAPPINPPMPGDGSRRTRPTIWRPPAREGRPVRDGREGREGRDGARAAAAMAAGLGTTQATAATHGGTASVTPGRVEPGFRAPADPSAGWSRSEPTAPADWLRGTRAPSHTPPAGVPRAPMEPPRAPMQQGAPLGDPRRQAPRSPAPAPGVPGAPAATGMAMQPNAPWRAEPGHARPSMSAAMAGARAASVATHSLPLAGAAAVASGAARGFPSAGAPASSDPLTSPFAQPAMPRRSAPPPSAGSTAARAAAAAPPRVAKPPRPFVWQGQPPRVNARPPVAAPLADTPPATPSYSRPTPAGAAQPSAALSTSVLETLRSIEENAARWTTLAGASLARRNLDEAAAIPGTEEALAEEPHADAAEPATPRAEFPTAAPHISTPIAAPVAQAPLAPSTPPVAPLPATAPFAQQDENHVPANAGAQSFQQTSGWPQWADATESETLAAHADSSPAVAQSLARPEGLPAMHDQADEPTPWQPARRYASQTFSAAEPGSTSWDTPQAKPPVAKPAEPAPAAAPTPWPTFDHGMPWVLLDDEPSTPETGTHAAEPFDAFAHASASVQAPEHAAPITVPELPAMQAPAVETAPAKPSAAEPQAADSLALSPIVHFPRLVHEAQHDATEAPVIVSGPVAGQTLDAETVDSPCAADLDEPASVESAYGTYGGVIETSAHAMPGHVAATIAHPLPAQAVEAAPLAAPEQTTSTEATGETSVIGTAAGPFGHETSSGTPRVDVPPETFDLAQAVASATAETAAEVAEPQPSAPVFAATSVPAAPQMPVEPAGSVPFVAPLSSNDAAAPVAVVSPALATPAPFVPAAPHVPATCVTPPWATEPQPGSRAPDAPAFTAVPMLVATPVAAAAAPYPAAATAPVLATMPVAASPDFEPEPEPEAAQALEAPEPPVQRAPVRGHAPTTFVFEPLTASAVELPGVDLLERASSEIEPVSEQKLAETSQLIEQRLQEFKVPVTVVGASAGPVITRFEVEPALGVRGSQIVGLMKDLSRGLGLTSIRVVETIPGKTCMGLELPNARRQMIRLSEILESAPYHRSQSKLTIAMGKDIVGHPIVTDLAKAPHMLVAGTTGSGKSVAINAMILSLLYKATPEDVRLIMIDPKMLELSVYEGIPHLLAPVVTDMKLAANALNWCVGEMEKRYRLMSAVGVRNLAGFNQKIRDAEAQERKIGNPFSLTPEAPEPLSPLPMIVVVIDELADLMMVAGKKIEELIARLAQKARAAGIHLILATQRPSVDVITGLIKANIPTRVAFQVSSKIDSRTILDQMGAESLLGQGDMLFLPPGTGYPQRVHGAFVADEEVHAVVEYLKQFGEPEYVEGILDGPTSEGAPQDLFGDSPEAEADPLYDEAVAFVVRTRRASISSVQRQLRIGYNRAARLVEQMETAGLVSPMGINGSREVLVPGGGQGE